MLVVVTVVIVTVIIIYTNQPPIRFNLLQGEFSLGTTLGIPDQIVTQLHCGTKCGSYESVTLMHREYQSRNVHNRRLMLQKIAADLLERYKTATVVVDFLENFAHAPA